MFFTCGPEMIGDFPMLELLETKNQRGRRILCNWYNYNVIAANTIHGRDPTYSYAGLLSVYSMELIFKQEEAFRKISGRGALFLRHKVIDL